MRMTPTASIAAVLLACTSPLHAQSPGVGKDEIRIGQTMPYSGNASAYGVVGRAMVAYFDKLNREQGGINGRKIKLTSLDDGYSPPKTVEQTRKLVEQDDVLLIFGTLGTPTNTAIHKYLNAKRVPHLLVTSGADKWADPKSFPWTDARHGLLPDRGSCLRPLPARRRARMPRSRCSCRTTTSARTTRPAFAAASAMQPSG